MFYALLSHIYWYSWTLIQAANSPIDFNFFEYHFLRRIGFQKHAQLLGLDREE